jgi:hypothetical protein
MSDGQDKDDRAGSRDTAGGAGGTGGPAGGRLRLLSAVWESPRPVWRGGGSSTRGACRPSRGSAPPPWRRSRSSRGSSPAGRDGADRAEPRADDAATGEFPTPTGAPDAALAGVVPVIPAAAIGARSAPVATQFVLDRADARSVSLVGDFNEWQGGALPLTRLESGLWTVDGPARARAARVRLPDRRYIAGGRSARAARRATRTTAKRVPS